MTRSSCFRLLGPLALALLALHAPPATAQSSRASAAPALQGETCSVQGLMDQIRRGLSSKSKAYQNYLRTLLREAAVTLPGEELRAAFERETDPLMVEHLAAALVARSEREADLGAMDLVARRALEDRDPALRSASVRALRRTGALEKTGDLYRECDVGLCFMFTKHPSYLPFEMMACGVTVVTNDNPANLWLLKHEQNCLLAEPTYSCVLEQLRRAVTDAQLRARIGTAAAARMLHTNWETQVDKVYASLMARTQQEPAALDAAELPQSPVLRTKQASGGA